MNAAGEAELMLAAHYLRDKAESVAASSVRADQFREFGQLGECWRLARQMTEQRREWLPLDVDKRGVMDSLLRDVTPIAYLVPLAERRVIEAAALASFREGLGRLAAAANGDQSLREVSSLARKLVGELESEGPVQAETFAEVGRRRMDKFVAAFDDPEQSVRTIPMPTQLMTAALGGWRRGKLHLVGAITSGHKTTVARQACEVACKAGFEGLYWTAEDSNEDIAGRTLAANISALTTGCIETLDVGGLAEQQIRDIISGAAVVGTKWARRLRMIDKPNPTLYEVIGTIRQMASKPLDFVVFDFLQRIRRDDKNIDTTEHWDRCTAELRALAQQLDIALVCPVQPTQEGTKRVEDGKPLRIGDLKGGASIAQNSYGVVTLFRTDAGLEVYVRKWKGADKVKFRCWVSGSSDMIGDATK